MNKKSLNRLCYVVGMLVWFFTAITIVIPIIYWIVMGKSYFDLFDRLNKIEIWI